MRTIYGPKEPIDDGMHCEVIVLSSEDEVDVDHVDNHASQEVAVHEPDGYRRSTKSSRNIQRSIWEYVGYASDSDASMTSDATTANSIHSHGYKAYLQVRGAQTHTNDFSTELHSSNSSQSSNDPFGKELLHNPLVSRV